MLVYLHKNKMVVINVNVEKGSEVQVELNEQSWPLKITVNGEMKYKQTYDGDSIATYEDSDGNWFDSKLVTGNSPYSISFHVCRTLSATIDAEMITVKLNHNNSELNVDVFNLINNSYSSRQLTIMTNEVILHDAILDLGSDDTQWVLNFRRITRENLIKLMDWEESDNIIFSDLDE